MSDAMIHAKRTFAVAALFALAACSVLPPSLRPAQAPAGQPLPEAAQAVAAQAAARDQAAKDGQAPTSREGARVYPGRGRVIANPVPKAEPGKPPEEASLNFDSA